MELPSSTLMGIAVSAFVFLALLVEYRSHHKVRVEGLVPFRIAAQWVGVAVGLFSIIALYFWFIAGPKVAFEYTNAQMAICILGVDNLFALIAVYKTQKLHAKYQHLSLMLAIGGMMFFKVLFLQIGTTQLMPIMQRHPETLYIIPAALLALAAWMAYHLLTEDGHADKESWAVRQIGKWMPVSTSETSLLTIIEDGKRMVTIPFVCGMGAAFADLVIGADTFFVTASITERQDVMFISCIASFVAVPSQYYSLLLLQHQCRYVAHAVVAVLVYLAATSAAETSHTIEHVPQAVNCAVLGGCLALGVIASRIREIWRRFHPAVAEPVFDLVEDCLEYMMRVYYKLDDWFDDDDEKEKVKVKMGKPEKSA